MATMKNWIERQTKSGLYGSAYVRDLIRRDQEPQSAIGELQNRVDDELSKGLAKSFDAEAFPVSKRAAHARRSA